MTEKQRALDSIEQQHLNLESLSDAIWDHPEVGYHESFAADALCSFLEENGFQVERGLAGIPTAFCGSYGSGAPVIGLLGEFDALPGMSQKAGCFEKSAVSDDQPGHGCGHNLLGVGALAAALGLKAYLEAGHSGTVKFFGCPAEEGGSGKGFMARAGVFRGLDAAFSWHPGDLNSVSTESTMANYQISYRFQGIASHAALSPELGRSALDALELMNVGVQFLREHVRDDVRLHYTVLDAGGPANVVPAYAKAYFELRSASGAYLTSVAERFKRIAQGAAMMTDTTVEITHLLRMESKIPVHRLNQLLMEKAELVGAPGIRPPAGSNASTDFGNVMSQVPGSCIRVKFVPAGTATHSQAYLDAGKSREAHEAIVLGAGILALAAADMIEDPALFQAIREEFARNRAQALSDAQ